MANCRRLLPFTLLGFDRLAVMVEEKTSPPTSGLKMTPEELEKILEAIERPGLNNLYSFSKIFSMKEDDLLRLLYKNPLRNYATFQIRKKSGLPRNISAPKARLKKIQRILADYLGQYYTPKTSAHGFIEDRSVKTNALPHVGKKYVFNIDLKDFFESIHFGRVRNLFMSSPFNAPHNVASVMAHMCCHGGKLAQGAPTSPIISNMLARKLDSQLQALAASKKSHYTRYADDITFSFTCTKKYLPKDIVEVSDEGVAIPGGQLQSIINSNGFSINTEKTRIKHCTQRQVVTGLTVNKFPNLSRAYIRKTGSMIHALRKYGAVLAEEKYLEYIGVKDLAVTARQRRRIRETKGDFFIKVVKGRLNYIQMIRGRDDLIYRKLAYSFTVAIGKENKEYLKSAEELLANSIFHVDNISASDSQGTAFFLEGVGIVTNYHVIDGVSYSSAPDMIYFSRPGVDGGSFSTRLIYFDKRADIAIFSMNQDVRKIPPLKKAKKDSIRPLDPILVIGFPQHVDGAHPYISRGNTVQKRRQVDLDLWLVNINLVKGNSGGPVFNSSMEVVGVATKGAGFDGSHTVVHGFIPIESLNRLLKKPEFLFSKRLHDWVGNGCLKYVPRSRLINLY